MDFKPWSTAHNRNLCSACANSPFSSTPHWPLMPWAAP